MMLRIISQAGEQKNPGVPQGYTIGPSFFVINVKGVSLRISA
jgi:hypothetical protein